MYVTLRLLLFLLFFPVASPPTPPSKPTTNQPTYRLAISIFLICLLHLFATFLISTIIIYRTPSHLSTWAHFLGILGTVLAGIQYLPQIWTTWKLQAVGSLSIPMMCIQTPGSFVWVGSLAARFGWEGWSTWGIFLVTGVLQGILLVMAVGFEVREWRKMKAGGNEEGEDTNGYAHEDDERTGLLGNER